MISRTAGRRLVILAFWMLFGAITGLQIQVSMLAHHHSWTRVIGYQLLVWALWIGFTFLIVGLIRRVPLAPARASAWIVHAATAIAIGLAHTAIWVALELVLVPYDFMNPTAFLGRFEKVALCQMPLELLLYGLVALAHLADESVLLTRERERKAVQLEASLAKARMVALELQTQPHFLFNTLNGIGSLVRAGQNTQALATIGGLSELLRYALDRSGGVAVALEEEVGMLARYLEIQRVRFPDRLTIEIDLAPDTLRAAMPAFLLQPLAENAVRHGIARSDAPGRIVIRSARAGDDLRIEVFNTGKLDTVRRNGIGLTTTAARLRELHGERARLDLLESDGGVLARVTLPFCAIP